MESMEGKRVVLWETACRLSGPIDTRQGYLIQIKIGTT